MLFAYFITRKKMNFEKTDGENSFDFHKDGGWCIKLKTIKKKEKDAHCDCQQVQHFFFFF